MRIFLSDMYRVESSYPLDDIQTDVLYCLYQPIIGAEALSIYMMLYIESKRMTRHLAPCQYSRLISLTGMSLLDIEKAILKLEGIGLLKSYKKIEHGVTLYLFKIQSPLTLQKFFKNQILSSLLEEAMVEDDFNKTIQYFKISSTDVSTYEDVTVRFGEVYKITQGKNRRRVLSLNDTKQQSVQDVKSEYDTDLLFQSLLEYQISRIRLSDDDVDCAVSLAIVYSIDPFTLAGLIKDSMTSLGLDQDVLKANIKKFYDIDSLSQLNEVYHSQPVIYKTNANETSILAEHMKYLDSITPYEFLKAKQGGKEPIFHDLKIVETLMVQLGLNPSVVNVLLEYVLGKSDNKLSKNYCETIGASLARKKVLTAMEAYRVLMNDNEETEEHTLEEKTEVKEEIKADNISFQELLSRLGD